MTDRNEIMQLRDLAKCWNDIALKPIMSDRRLKWRNLHDLKPNRPMFLFETSSLNGFVDEKELISSDPLLRYYEKILRHGIRHAKLIDDDYVLEPWLPVSWNIKYHDYGVDLQTIHAADSIAYTYNYPIKVPDDAKKLAKQTFTVDRERTYETISQLEEVFGDTIEIKLHGVDWFLPAISMNMYKLIGMENMYFWMCDNPESIHLIASYLGDDFNRYLSWLAHENLIGMNNENQIVGSGSYGYISSLPSNMRNNKISAEWIWIESQETASISPEMFAEFILPYLAATAKPFDYVYYGCCEPVHDRWDCIEKAIPNIRSVSISPWCDCNKMGEILAGRYVFSRKPPAPNISGVSPDWDVIKDELESTLQAAKDCNIEIIYRDVYDIGYDLSRLKKWGELSRSYIGN